MDFSKINKYTKVYDGEDDYDPDSKESYFEFLVEQARNYPIPIYWASLDEGDELVLQINNPRTAFKAVMENHFHVMRIKGNLMNKIFDIEPPQRVSLYVFPQGFKKAFYKACNNIGWTRKARKLKYLSPVKPFTMTIIRESYKIIKIVINPKVDLSLMNVKW